MKQSSINAHPGEKPPLFSAAFMSMASPCQVDINIQNKKQAEQLISLIQKEAWRIEQKFSRFRQDNLIYLINQGKTVQLDDEIEKILHYAENCYQLSDGLFDITTGTLKKIWRFNDTFQFPSVDEINDAKKSVGWEKVIWHPPFFQLPPKMEIDFGGLVKEYAVDKCAQLLMEHFPDDFLINFGGDLFIKGKHTIGIENPHLLNHAASAITANTGGIATSGTSRQYIDREGKRYSHIINPKTGYPVEEAPKSVTVFAETCIEAGFYATLALLQGKNAQKFCDENEIKAWCIF